MIVFTVLVSLFALVAGGLTLAAGAWEIGTALFVVAIFGLYVANEHKKEHTS